MHLGGDERSTVIVTVIVAVTLSGIVLALTDDGDGDDDDGGVARQTRGCAGLSLCFLCV